MIHKHHIIPKHAGGTNDPTNIVKLTIAEHANEHKKLYEKFGRWQDKIAWLTLSGQITNVEATRIAQKMAKEWLKDSEKVQRAMKKRKENWIKKGGKPGIPWNKGKTKEIDPRLKKASIIAKQNMQEGKINCIGDAMRGTKFTEQHKSILSERAKNRKKLLCNHCGGKFVAQTFVRFHGDKCKGRKV